MIDKKIFFLVQPVQHWKTPSNKYFRAWHYIIHEIATDKSFCSQVTTVFSMNNRFKNKTRPNLEIQMDWKHGI